MPDTEKNLPLDWLELLLTSRRTFVMRLRSDLVRLEGDMQWCERHMPNGKALPGDDEAADLIRRLIAVKEQCVGDLESIIADASKQG